MSFSQAGAALPKLPLTPLEAAALDDETSLAECTRWHLLPSGAREAESVFALQGMYCAACAGVIEAALGEALGNSPANAAATAGNENDLSFDAKQGISHGRCESFVVAGMKTRTMKITAGVVL